MKKTFLISLFLLFTSSVFAVSIPGGGLGAEGNIPDNNYYYSEGFGLRSLDQVGDEVYGDPTSPDPTEYWQGTWPDISDDSSAEQVMGMPPARYVEEYCTNKNNSWTDATREALLVGVQNECMSKGGRVEPCYNYAVDVYNLALTSGYFQYGIGSNPTFIGYYQVPVSTDITFMALMLAAYLGFAAYRKKRSMAKI